MKILHLCGYTWAIGGPAKMIYDHTSVHAALGEQITILTPISPGDIVYPAAPGVKVLTFPRHSLSNILPEFSPQLFQYVKENAHQYDLIHLHGLWHFCSIAPLLARIKVPMVQTIHGVLDRWAMQQGQLKKNVFKWLIQKKAVENCKLIHVNNQSEIEDVNRFLGYEAPNTIIVPNGLRPADFRTLPERGSFRRRIGVDDQQPLILFLSRINKKKGLDLLLPAFQQLRQTHPDAVLALAGPNDGFLSEATSFVQQHQLTDVVKFPGMLVGDEKLAAYADASVFALPTYSESFSIAALEALASGVPSLLTEHVGYGDYLRQYSAAQLCETNVESVHAGLVSLLDNPQAAQQLARNAHQMIDEVCDIDKLSRKLLNAYYQVVAKK